MSFKSILTVVTDAADPPPSLEQAISLARDLDAHLEVICLGIDHALSSYYEVGVGAALLQASLEQAQSRGKKIREAVEKRLERSGLRTNTSIGVVTSPDTGNPVARIARFSDLAVASLPYGPGATPENVSIVEELLFDAACPTLCLPRDAELRLPESIVVAWNFSAQALRATRVALPFLKAAKQVRIAAIDPPGHGPEGSDPGGQLAVLLSRHGVNCEISVLAKTGSSVGASLNQFAQENGADMIVMGAYGHSRFREALLGGTTRVMLQEAKLPVLMAH
ncbi:universal stress protein [Sulfitobacter sp. D35]|uniref:universal stress protein n=1 Tax=Sulfitobacter sp. D35 TaxID=3083252 RepID=UPI00296FF115|nr:universal stress protein [Sulfitobacter sp. D35]MDW4497260.1 universal stress protein [Sulfitobacter sp. D35]